MPRESEGGRAEGLHPLAAKHDVKAADRDRRCRPEGNAALLEGDDEIVRHRAHGCVHIDRRAGDGRRLAADPEPHLRSGPCGAADRDRDRVPQDADGGRNVRVAKQRLDHDRAVARHAAARAVPAVAERDRIRRRGARECLEEARFGLDRGKREPLAHCKAHPRRAERANARPVDKAALGDLFDRLGREHGGVELFAREDPVAQRADHAERDTGALADPGAGGKQRLHRCLHRSGREEHTAAHAVRSRMERPRLRSIT